MFEPVPEVGEAVDLLMQLSHRYERGQCILWPEIEVLSGDRNSNRGKHVILRWRRRLEKERGIVTLCKDTVGVRLLTHAQTAEEIPRLRQRKAYRQVKRGLRQTACVDVERLSMAERRLLAAQRQEMAAQRRSIFRSLRDAKAIPQTTPVNPMRPLPVSSLG